MTGPDRLRVRRLLALDSAANYVLGLPLLLAPRQAARLLALPEVNSGFYPRVLGGVLTGVASALAVESRRDGASGPVGLGMAGAVAINAAGAGSLAIWLASSDARALPRRGRVLLWTVASGVVAIGALEVRGGALAVDGSGVSPPERGPGS